MKIECLSCGQSGNIKTGANMGWFKIVINKDGKIIIICKDCGEEVELEY